MAVRNYIHRALARESAEVRRLKEQVTSLEGRLKVVEEDYERRKQSALQVK